jgi:hypothetical protein
MASIQERFLIKSGLRWHAYGIRFRCGYQKQKNLAAIVVDKEGSAQEFQIREPIMDGFIFDFLKI